MKKLLAPLFLLLALPICHAQTGLIAPGKTYLNSGSDTLFYMPKAKLITFKNCETNLSFSLQKLEMHKELRANLQERIFLADSTLALKRIEANIWFSKLQNNDYALEEQRKINLHLIDDKDRIRRSRIYYFVGGVLATSLVFIAVK